MSGAFSELTVPIPRSHSEELDRRLADYEKNADTFVMLEDLQARVGANGRH